MEILKRKEGQATVEYILMLVVVVGLYFLVVNWMSRSNFGGMLITYFSGDFAHAYQYGNPKTLGFGETNGGDVGPKNHPRVVDGDATNFHIFIVNQSGGAGGDE